MIFLLGVMNTAAIILLCLMTGSLGVTLNCSSLYDRYPANSDLTVTCGPSSIVLSINACPIQYAEFDPTMLTLNGNHSLGYCNGTIDNSVEPPVVTFNFPINDTTQNSCGNVITIENNVGTGDFHEFSNVETVVISGYVNTPVTPNAGLISYSTNLNYNFSCYYPLQYLLSNIELLTSSANVAVNTNNGSFISTLSMQLYADANFTIPLQVNGTALPLKQNVYVQVTATNLTANFNVLLDECFATPSPLSTTIDKFSLLTGCSSANKTTVIINGAGKSAQFSFQTFRFLQHSGQPVSTIYISCITRLCQPQTCQSYLQACNSVNQTTPAPRRRRAASMAATEGTTEQVTVSSGPIALSDAELTDLISSQSSSGSAIQKLEANLIGLIVGLIIAVILVAVLVMAGFMLYKMSRHRASQNEKMGVDNFTFNGK
ncbi:Zona pellucida-like domain-containing protein 1 [Aquarana catesbeiana]|uniref:Zona pellucida-like domain-containing protein 1 n=1 Tax=Aquarana catesbeiana TaxID=8400 RepID=A0A2G9SLS6_AQUCT|nr:Zona pellucida-like domain-containing protein 1 [Aquarana catesbeiana]